MTTRSITRKLVLAVAPVLAFAIPASAQATVLKCGQTVRKDVILKEDLDCSAGGTGGLVVGADGVTIDLNKHAVIGAGGSDGYEGIEANGYSDVTIENGTVRGWQDQVLLNDVVRATVQDTYLKPSSFGYYNGIMLSYGTGVQLVHNKINNANVAIQSQNGSANLIADNTIKDATGGVVTKSEIADKILDNESEGFFSTTGFYSVNDTGAKFRGDAANGGYEGFYIQAPSQVKIGKVTANHNVTSGIYVDSGVPSNGWGAGIWNSTANENGDYGIYAAYPVASSGNVAVRNASHNCNLVRCNG